MAAKHGPPGESRRSGANHAVLLLSLASHQVVWNGRASLNAGMTLIERRPSDQGKSALAIGLQLLHSDPVVRCHHEGDGGTAGEVHHGFLN